MPQRRKALVIMGFETRDRAPSKVEKGWSRDAVAKGETPLGFTTSADFLIARDKNNKRAGFVEVELLHGESPMSAFYRLNKFSTTAILQRWEEIDRFEYPENNNVWQVLVGVVLVHPDQRSVDLYDGMEELPFLLEWQTPHWLYRQQQDNLLNLVTSVALAKSSVRDFLFDTQRKPRSGKYLPGNRRERVE